MAAGVNKADLSRKGFLKKLGLGLVVGPIASHIFETFAKDPQEKKIDHAVESHFKKHDPLYISRMEGSIKSKINDYHYIMKKFASKDVDTYTDESKFDYVQGLLQKSSLPQYLKDTIPFVPFQESGYRLSVVSKAGAKGPWQFMESTARTYGIVQGKGKEKKDYRSDMKKSTNAAIAYFGYLYKRLKSDIHYKNLESKYGLMEDDLLLPATINAYNSGPGHMQYAFEVMDTETSIQKDIARFSQHRRGLFVYLTNNYVEKWKKYQEPHFQMPPYYYKESANYVYSIEAFKYINKDGSFDELKGLGSIDKQHIETVPQPSVQASFPLSVHALLGAASGLGIYLAGRQIQKGSSQLSRRDFFASNIAAVGGAIGSGVYHGYENIDAIRDNMKYALDTDKLQKLSYDDILSEERNAVFMEIYYRAIAIARRNGNDRAVQTLSKRSLKDNMDLAYYPGFQYLGDAAFDIYKEKSDNEYIQMAQYFYNKAWTLVEEQKLGKYKQPKQGIEKLTERTRYCKRALDMIDVEFSK